MRSARHTTGFAARVPRSRRRGRAQQRHGRRSAGRQLRRTAGNVPERAGAETPCWQLAAAALPRCSPTGRFPIAWTRGSTTCRSPSRSACSGWSARTWPLRSDVLDRYRNRLSRRRAHQCRLRPGRKRRSRLGESGRILRLQADVAAGLPADHRKNCWEPRNSSWSTTSAAAK